ncbi:MAG: HesA/MoeB/ThiF family protein, partial [Phycisphaerae bacterium]|nr:HesA/MoeB/ThiF family protein [Phycisphaerae bacterium]
MDVTRYQRQALLPAIGAAGQQRLTTSAVLIIGCGALGATAADLLARAGVGFLRLVDRDVVDKTNLQRQTLYDEQDVDLPKAEAAAGRLRRVNSDIQIDPIVSEANPETIDDLIRFNDRHVDLIIDGSDNIETRYLINDASIAWKIPWIYGGCVATEGRCMVIRPGVTPCLRCIFSGTLSDADATTCDTAGILGPVATVVASLQATAAIQLLTGNANAIPRGLTHF